VLSCRLKLEAWGWPIAVGWGGEVPGRKGVCQETTTTTTTTTK
jgi:hypothetical protein